jgi:hypothetical protein
MSNFDQNSQSASSTALPTASRAYDSGGGIPDPNGVIPQDPQDPSAMQDTGTACDPSANASPQQINDALSAVMDALQYGRQINGLSNGQQVAGNMPVKPAAPGGDQPSTDPFSTRTPAIPFGKRTASNDTESTSDSEGDNDSDDQTAIASAKGGPVERPSPKVKRYDDGGDVDNPAAQAQTAMPPPPSPQPTQGAIPAPGQSQGGTIPKLASYVLGKDAAPQQQIQGLENQVDPQGTMDPSTRKLLAVAAAGDQGSQWSVLQGYRQKFDAYKSFARAALNGTPQKPGDIGAAAKAATQAFQNAPDGNSVNFIPHKGGVAVQVRNLGKATKKMNGGGPVQRYEDGGPAQRYAGVTPEDNDPDTESQNISNEAGAGTTFLTPDQLNSFLSGIHSTFDNILNTPVSQALMQAQKDPGTPPTPQTTGSSTPQGTPNAQPPAAPGAPTQPGLTSNPAGAAAFNTPNQPNPGAVNPVVGQNPPMGGLTAPPPVTQTMPSGNKYQPGPGGTLNPEVMGSPGTFAGPTKGMGPPTPEDVYKGFDPDDVTAAKARFPGSINQQIDMLENQKQQQAERQNRIDVWSQRGQNQQAVAQLRVEHMDAATKARTALGFAQIASQSKNATLRAAASLVAAEMRNVPLGQPLSPQAQQAATQIIADGLIPPALLPPQAPQTQASQPQQNAGPLPLPSSKSQLVAGQSYQTGRGVATWDGSQFTTGK